METIIIGLIIFIGIIMLVAVALKPKLFWPLLIAATVGTGGIVIQSVGVADEYLTVLILFGCFMFFSIGKNIHSGEKRASNLEKIHWWIFIIMLAYMILQSSRGLVELESLRKVRWILYFFMLGILSFVLLRRTFPIPSPKKISFTIAATGLIYFLTYLVMGLFYQVILDRPKWDIQNVVWGGTTYAAFPIIIIMPVIIFILREKGKYYRQLGWITLCIVTIASFYYESRISWMVILAFFIFFLPALGFRKFIASFIILFLILNVSFSLFMPKWYNLKIFSQILYQGSELIWKPAETSDYGRAMHLQIAFPIISENWNTFLFGYGFRASGPLIGPHLAELYRDRGMFEIAKQAETYQSTVGITALITETGIIGLILLLANFFLTAWAILFQKRKCNRLILALSLIFAFLWMLITDPIDIILFYFLIMPSGLLIQLAKPDREALDAR